MNIETVFKIFLHNSGPTFLLIFALAVAVYKLWNHMNAGQKELHDRIDSQHKKCESKLEDCERKLLLVRAENSRLRYILHRMKLLLIEHGIISRHEDVDDYLDTEMLRAVTPKDVKQDLEAEDIA